MAKPISSSYTDEEKAEIVTHVCDQLAVGRCASRILAEDAGMPSYSTFWLWTAKNEELSKKVADARAQGVEVLLDETLEIADDAVNDYLEKRDEKTENKWWEFQRENVLRSKLRIETRIKMAQMLKPKTYGPKLDLTSDGKALGLSAELEAARRRAAKSEGEE